MSVGWVEGIAARESVEPDLVVWPSVPFEQSVTVTVAERDRLVRAVRALERVQIEELNGRLCPRPESAEDRCCPVCRDLWGEIDEVLAGPQV